LIFYIIQIFLDEKDCYDCEEVLRELEHIDDEADDLDIMFVKIRDMRYARKYGISEVPALIFFRKKFPAIYRGINGTTFHINTKLYNNKCMT
jgi:hypothetical protein